MARSSVLARLLERWAREKLAKVGVSLNDPYGELNVEVHDPTLYLKVILGGSLAFGEGYQRGLWDCARLDELVARIRGNDVEVGGIAKAVQYVFGKTRKLRLQNKKRAKVVAETHYDIDNALYRVMLGPTMQYSCAYFESGPLAQRLYGRAAQTLDEAQVAKLTLLGEKLHLTSGMRVLDVGCGWGFLARFLAKTYGVEVVGITLSQEQAAGARENCAGLPVDIYVMDYRDVHERLGEFDRIVSVGMLEHVGPAFYDEYMRTMYACLKARGIFVLHTIVGHGSAERWLNRYIFPYGVLPTIEHIQSACKDTFAVWDWHEFGTSYAKTLRCWWQNFNAAWPEFEGKPNNRGVYDMFFYRTWRYYLLACAGLFDARYSKLFQFVLAKEDAPACYQPVR